MNREGPVQRVGIEGLAYVGQIVVMPGACPVRLPSHDAVEGQVIGDLRLPYSTQLNLLPLVVRLVVLPRVDTDAPELGFGEPPELGAGIGQSVLRRYSEGHVRSTGRLDHRGGPFDESRGEPGKAKLYSVARVVSQRLDGGLQPPLDHPVVDVRSLTLGQQLANACRRDADPGSQQAERQHREREGQPDVIASIRRVAGRRPLEESPDLVCAVGGNRATALLRQGVPDRPFGG
jgi:hypothetical protein